MSLSRRRITAIVRKELREFRRNRSLVATMAIFPFIFLIQPLVLIFRVPGSTAGILSQGHVLLYMLAIPVLVPASVAASAVVGERQQGSLEPVLTTPIRPEELLLGKALATLLPSVAIAYAVYAIFIACVVAFAQPGVGSAILRGQDIVAQVVLTPLLACCAVWIGIAISTRTSDVRVSQQLSLLGSLPLVALTSLAAFDVIHATLELALGFGVVLLVVDLVGWRIVARLFDRERLMTGTH